MNTERVHRSGQAAWRLRCERPSQWFTIGKATNEFGRVRNALRRVMQAHEDPAARGSAASP